MKTHTSMLTIGKALLLPGLALGSAFLVSCAPSSSSGNNFLSDYSQLKQRSRLDDKITYEAGLHRVPEYKRVYLEEVRVLPPENSAERKITAQDVQRMQDIFQEALKSEIAASRFSLASRPGEGTISLRAAVVDLKPGNPAIFAATYAPYAGSASTVISAAQGENLGAGSATVEAEVVDSLSRDQLIAVIDKNPGSKLQVVEGMNRWGHIEVAFKEWARDFRLALEGEINSLDF